MDTENYIICVGVRKGGTGKTTSVVSIASDYAKRYGYKTLIVDVDLQNSVCDQLGLEISEGTRTVRDALIDGGPLPVYDISENLSIVPSEDHLCDLEGILYYQPDNLSRLKRLLAPLRQSFQRILIDTSPFPGIVTKNAIMASDYVIIPTEASYISWKGYQKMKQDIIDIKTKGGTVGLLGVFFANFDRLAISNRISKLIDERESPTAFGEIKYLFRNRIRSFKVFKEAREIGKSIFDYAPESKGAMDYANLTDEVELRIKQYNNWVRI